MPILQRYKEKILKRDPAVTEIDLSSSGLDDADAKTLQDLLLKNPYIIKLVLSRNNITSKSIKYLSECKNIESLNLSQNKLDTGVAQLMTMPKLKVLNLNDNNLDNESARAVLQSCGPNLFVTVYGNPSVDRCLVDEIDKKCMLKVKQKQTLHSSHWEKLADSSEEPFFSTKPVIEQGSGMSIKRGIEKK